MTQVFRARFWASLFLLGAFVILLVCDTGWALMREATSPGKACGLPAPYRGATGCTVTIVRTSSKKGRDPRGE